MGTDRALAPAGKAEEESRPPDHGCAQGDDSHLLHPEYGLPWNALARSLGAYGTVHEHFQRWREAGVFERMWQIGLQEYDKRVRIEWEWPAMHGAMTKAPLGEKGTGSNPTDRGKSGTKRSLLTEGQGIPLVVAVDGANRHDMQMAEGTLLAIVIERPEPTEEDPQNLCLDKGFDYDEVRELLAPWGYTVHIRTRGEKTEAKERVPGHRARRWVVERTYSWLNRFRRLLIRWEKKAENYLAMLHYACAWITFPATGLFE